MTDNAAEKGQNLLSAVERITEAPETIVERVHMWRRQAGPNMDRLAPRIVQEYSNKSAFVGGMTALPGLIPGLGTLAVSAGSTLADMALVMKLEVEMCIALVSAHGHDVLDPRERQIGFLLAAIGTHEVESGRNVLLDLGEVSATAFWSYSPRELAKLVAHAFGALAIVWASKYLTKGVLRAIPIVGIGVGAGMNKVLTQKVGNRAHDGLLVRARHMPARG